MKSDEKLLDYGTLVDESIAFAYPVEELSEKDEAKMPTLETIQAEDAKFRLGKRSVMETIDLSFTEES